MEKGTSLLNEFDLCCYDVMLLYKLILENVVTVIAVLQYYKCVHI